MWTVLSNCRARGARRASIAVRPAHQLDKEGIRNGLRSASVGLTYPRVARAGCEARQEAIGTGSMR